VDKDKKLVNTESLFIKKLAKVFGMQLIFQILFTILLFALSLDEVIGPIQYINMSLYFFIFIISLSTLRPTIANKPFVLFFVLEFLYLAVSPWVLLFAEPLLNIIIENPHAQYNISVFLDRANTIIVAIVSIMITLYLFFFSITPKNENLKKHILFASIISIGVFLLTFSNLELFVDYYLISHEEYYDSLYLLRNNIYYINIFNLSFLIFIWFTYYQGQYILSEYLAAVLSMHTLMIVNEIYQLYNFTNLMENYIDGQYFNAIVNFGFVAVWLIRLNYITRPECKKNEHYVLNYDLLSGYVEKPHKGFIVPLLFKLGKQKLYFASISLFLLISVPFLFLGDFSFFARFNIILILVFIGSVLVYAIIYTQRKWFTQVGFLIEKNKSDTDQ